MSEIKAKELVKALDKAINEEGMGKGEDDDTNEEK